MNGSSFPALAPVDLGSDGDAGPLEEAARKLIEVRNYLFFDDEAPTHPSDSKEPASPENMADLRRYLERVCRKLDAVIAFHGGGEQDGTNGRPGPAGATPSGARTAASGARPSARQGIVEAGQAAREKLLAARRAARITKGVAEDWDTLRNDLSRPDKWGTYRVLLDSQQEVEEAIFALADRLRQFMQAVSAIGNSGPGQAASGDGQHQPSRGRVVDGRPHYIPWQSQGVGRAS